MVAESLRETVGPVALEEQMSEALSRANVEKGNKSANIGVPLSSLFFWVCSESSTVLAGNLERQIIQCMFENGLQTFV